MTIQRKHHYPLAALAAAGLLTVGFSLSRLTNVHAQDVPPPAPPAAGPRPVPPAPRDGGNPGPKHGPREDGPDGPRPPRPPRAEDEAPAAQPVDPQAAPAAVKTAGDAAAGLTPGQVWTRTAPRGETQLQATVCFQNNAVARLEFDPATGALLPRGFHPAGSAAKPAPEPAAATTRAADPAATEGLTAPGGSGAKNGRAPQSPPAATAPPVTNAVTPDQIKTLLPEIIRGLSVGQGAEVMPREGFWKVPLIHQNRVVGELRISGDGQRLIQDFGAARDAAISARN